MDEDKVTYRQRIYSWQYQLSALKENTETTFSLAIVGEASKILKLYVPVSTLSGVPTICMDVLVKESSFDIDHFSRSISGPRSHHSFKQHQINIIMVRKADIGEVAPVVPNNAIYLDVVQLNVDAREGAAIRRVLKDFFVFQLIG